MFQLKRKTLKSMSKTQVRNSMWTEHRMMTGFGDRQGQGGKVHSKQ